MKAWMMIMIGMLASASVSAQSVRGGVASIGGSKEPGQCLVLKDITGVSGENEYTTNVPQVSEDVKTKIKHREQWGKESVKGWHYFDVMYQVSREGTNASAKTVPILSIPEVEITYALLYDMTKSKLAGTVIKSAKKLGGAIGWEDAQQRYVLLNETMTYQNITPGREHYAAVCVPPAFIVGHGYPLVFSVEIKVNGVRQGKILTKFMGGAKIGEKELEGLLYEKGRDGKPEATAWWDRIQNLSSAVGKQNGVLRDRSATPFALAGDQYYDQLKTK